MKKILSLLFSLCLLFIINFQYTFWYEIKPEIKERIDIKLESFYNKIWEKDLEIQVKVYKKLKTKLRILKNNYNKWLKLELIDYVINRVQKEYNKVLKEYLLEKKSENNFIKKEEIKQEHKKLIEEYYNNISIWKLEEAYLMKYNPSIKLEWFKKIYNFNDTIMIYVHNYNLVWKNKLNFDVDIWYDTKDIVERYNTTMEIIPNNKLKTISTKKVEKEVIDELVFNNIKFIVEWNKWEKILYIEKDWVKKVIKTIKVFSSMSIFSELYWLEVLDWWILSFKEKWWEYQSQDFYIIDKNKLIEWKWFLSLFWFTKDKKYFYLCWGAWMSWSSKFEIYDTNNWGIKKDLSKDYKTINYCKEYNQENNTLEFYLLWEEIKNNKYILEFDFFGVKIVRPYDKILNKGTIREVNSNYKWFYRDDNTLVYWERVVNVDPDEFKIYSPYGKKSTVIIHAGDSIYYTCRWWNIKNLIDYLNNQWDLLWPYKWWGKAIRYKFDQDKIKRLNELVIKYWDYEKEKKQKEQDINFNFSDSNLKNKMTELSTEIANLKWEIYGKWKISINIPIDIDTFKQVNWLLFKDKNDIYNFEADEWPYCWI